jgi:ABC-type Fe3+ transport system permease subunit
MPVPVIHGWCPHLSSVRRLFHGGSLCGLSALFFLTPGADSSIHPLRVLTCPGSPDRHNLETLGGTQLNRLSETRIRGYERLAGASSCTVAYLFSYLPMIILVVPSFNRATYSLEWKGFTLEWYAKLMEDEALWDVAFNSLTIAALSASLATILGTLGTVALYRYRFIGMRLLYGLTYVLIMSPEIVMGVSPLILFVRLNIPLGFASLLLSHITFCVRP